MSSILPFKRIECPIMRAYIAGILDFNSTFVIWRGTRSGWVHWTCRISVSTCETRLISLLNEQFRVQQITYKTKVPHPTTWRKTNEHSKRLICTWTATGGLLDHIIEIMLPHSIFNREFIEIIAEFRPLLHRSVRISCAVPSDVQARRDELYNKFLSIERRNFKMAAKSK